MDKTLNLDARRDLATRIRNEIVDGAHVIEVTYEPGDSTQYSLIFTHLAAPRQVSSSYCESGGIALAHGAHSAKSRWNPRGDRDLWLVTWPEVGSIVVRLAAGCDVWPDYIAEHMHVTGGSAAVISELLCMVCHVDESHIEQMRQVFPSTVWL